MRRWGILLVLVAAPSSALASSVTYTYTQPPQTDFLQPFGANILEYPVDPFNPSLGRLTAITFDYDYDATIHYVAAMSNPANGNGGASYYDPLGQYHYGNSTFDSGYLDLPVTETTNPASPLFDVTAQIDLHPVVTVTGANLAPYLTGADTYQVFDVNITPDFRGGGVATGTESASMSVTYSYVPAVPELPAWAGVVAGLAMIAGYTRRARSTGVAIGAPRSLRSE
jgi:hypothetical protein